jgi:peptidoglycan hydrolase CwlO-like protein
MKFFKSYKIYIFFSILIMFTFISSINSKKSNKTKRVVTHKKDIKRFENEIATLKEQLKIETLKTEELTKKLKSMYMKTQIN